MNNKELYNKICLEIDLLIKKYNKKELKILIKSLQYYIKEELKENE